MTKEDNLFFSDLISYPTQILISLNPSKTSNLVKAIPLILDNSYSLFNKNASNHPHLLCLASNCSKLMSSFTQSLPSSHYLQLEKDPDPTRVV